jgi:hypothetical protein
MGMELQANYKETPGSSLGATWWRKLIYRRLGWQKSSLMTCDPLSGVIPAAAAGTRQKQRQEQEQQKQKQ